MTERELAQNLGVSRPTVREAINKLVAVHLLEHRQGQGTFVNPPTAGAEKNPLAAVLNGQDASLMDLLEVRLGLEYNAVALAARRDTEEDVRELEKSVQEMAAAVVEGSLGGDADILNAIRQRDPDEAYAAMKRHITFVQDFSKERNIG